MASRYIFSSEEIQAIEQARKINKDKRVETRLKALEMRAKGASAKEVSEITGYHTSNVSRLVDKYRKKGLEGITGNHYGGHRRNMSIEEEVAVLTPFKVRAEKGQIVEISEIAAAYQDAVGRSVAPTHIYRVLHRHGWRKVMPRSKHPQKASDDEIEASKKLKPKSRS